MDSPTPGQAGLEVLSPTKESLRSRNQRPHLRLQELENELAKISQTHQRSSTSSTQALTPPIAPVTQKVQQTTLLSMTNVAVAMTASVATSAVVENYGPESQDEVVFTVTSWT